MVGYLRVLAAAPAKVLVEKDARALREHMGEGAV